MKKTFELLKTFAPLIALFHTSDTGNNVVIGGSNAILLHGLILGREVSDLDVIIYKPSSTQLKMLSVLESKSENLLETLKKLLPTFGSCAAAPSVKAKSNKPLEPSLTKRSIKYVHNGLTINFLIEDVSPDDNYLSFAYSGHSYLIQGVAKIVDAKASYGLGHSGKKPYCRAKDVNDLALLKNHNFNMPFDALINNVSDEEETYSE